MSIADESTIATSASSASVSIRVAKRLDETISPGLGGSGPLVST